MARRIYEFSCTDGCGVFEEYIDENVMVELCPTCGALSNRIVSAVRCNLEGFTGAFPDAYDKWSRVRKEKLNQERKSSAYDPNA